MKSTEAGYGLLVLAAVLTIPALVTGWQLFVAPPRPRLEVDVLPVPGETTPKVVVGAENSMLYLLARVRLVNRDEERPIVIHQAHLELRARRWLVWPIVVNGTLVVQRTPDSRPVAVSLAPQSPPVWLDLVVRDVVGFGPPPPRRSKLYLVFELAGADPRVSVPLADIQRSRSRMEVMPWLNRRD